jgi:hypothetical protein
VTGADVGGEDEHAHRLQSPVPTLIDA